MFHQDYFGNEWQKSLPKLNYILPTNPLLRCLLFYRISQLVGCTQQVSYQRNNFKRGLLRAVALAMTLTQWHHNSPLNALSNTELVHVGYGIPQGDDVNVRRWRSSHPSQHLPRMLSPGCPVRSAETLPCSLCSAWPIGTNVRSLAWSISTLR